MNVSASHCGSSGCESGWTFYLDQSSYSQTRYQKFGRDFDENYVENGARFVVEDDDEEEEEEEDLSMISDASSGPRHYYCEDYDENGSFSYDPEAASEPAKKCSKNKKKMKEHDSNIRQHSYLDDTASSPVISYSEKNFKKEDSIELLDFSQGFSATHFKGKSAFQKKFGFLKSGKGGSNYAGGFQGRKRGMTKG